MAPEAQSSTPAGSMENANGTSRFFPDCGRAAGPLSCMLSFAQPFGLGSKGDHEIAVQRNCLGSRNGSSLISSRDESRGNSKEVVATSSHEPVTVPPWAASPLDRHSRPSAEAFNDLAPREADSDYNSEVSAQRSGGSGVAGFAPEGPMGSASSSNGHGVLKRNIRGSVDLDEEASLVKVQWKGALKYEADSSEQRTRNRSISFSPVCTPQAEERSTSSAFPPRRGVPAVPLPGRLGMGRTLSAALAIAIPDEMCRTASYAPENPNNEFEPVLRAARMGRWAEAYTKLSNLEQQGKDPAVAFTSTLAERIRRIGARFIESLRELNPTDVEGWNSYTDRKSGIPFKFGLSSDNTYQVIATREYKGFDALTAFVALCEYDLWGSYQGMQVDCLEGRLNDGIWRCRRQTRRGREDSIMQVSTMDALEEESCKALWVSTYTPEGEGLTVLRRTSLPPVDEGCTRVEFCKNVYAVHPIWPNVWKTKEPERAFKLTYAYSRRTASASSIFPGVTMQREVADLFDKFQNFLEDKKKEIYWRMTFGEKANFYRHVHKHLADTAPFGAMALSTPLLELDFQDISEFLPMNWADNLAGCSHLEEDDVSGVISDHFQGIVYMDAGCNWDHPQPFTPS